jgi:iron complex transport system permease protein
MPFRSSLKKILFIWALVCVLCIFSLISLKFGYCEVPLVDAFKGFFTSLIPRNPLPESTFSVIVFHMRLPRILMALLVGSALAVSGIGMQGWFRNPLADPFLLGNSSGAALGVVCAFYFVPKLSQEHPWILPLIAFAFGVLPSYLAYQIPKHFHKTSRTTPLLVGLSMNLFAGALIGLFSITAQSLFLQHFSYWAWGSFANASWTQIAYMGPLISVLLGVFYGLAKGLNALALGELEAKALGINVKKVLAGVILCTTLMVSASVAFCGVIGFVGLIIPHCARGIVGSDHRYLIPAGALMGGLFLLAADMFIRSSFILNLEIPVGIVTTLLGIPFFLGLLLKAKRGTQSD